MEVDQPPTVELQKSLPSTSAGVKSTCTTSATHSAAETSAGDSAIESHKPTYAEKLQCSPAMRPKTVVSKPGNLGAPYTGEEREARLMRLVKRSEKIPFVDTHFHLNRLQEASHIESLEEILVSGPILLTLIELKYAVANFIDGVPTRGIRQELSKDKRLYFKFGVHPKRAYKYTPEEMKAIKTALVKDPRCVGIGEMGYDLTQGCSTFVDKQTKVFKEQLQYYLKKELWETVLVIHCRDLPNSTKASDYCLDAMESVLPNTKRGSYRIHRHCYNGGIKEKDAWLQHYPNTVFGFTGILLRGDRHPELDEVVKSLPSTKILLETDSPHLLPPLFSEHRYNTPYGIDEVARRIAFLRGLTIKEVFTITSFNAKRLYVKLPQEQAAAK